MDLTLPLDNAAIEKILLHRYPFLFVDRITEFEVDKRIVGIKNVSHNERYLSPSVDGRPALPPTILTEVVAQVGAIMILAKPEPPAVDLLCRHRARPLSAPGTRRRRRRD
jgi:3-hydroxyacyl-[acyl-carrier-protein] dehydratase